MPRSSHWPLLLLILLATPSLRGQEKGAGAPGRLEMVAYDDATRGFHLDHPKDWKQQRSSNPGIAIVFVNTRTEPGQHFNDNVNLIINRAGGAADINNLVDGAKAQLGQRLTAFHLVSDSKATMSGQPARKLVYTHQVQDLQMQVTQAFAIINDNIYTLTFTTLVERADGLAPAITAMIDSFRVDANKAANRAENTGNAKGPVELAQYVDSQHRFSFKYPATWQKRENPNPTVAVALSDTEAHSDFVENVNVGYRELPADVDIDDVVKGTANALAKQFSDFTVVENSKIDIDGRSGRKLIYTGKRGIPMKITQIFVIDHRKFYTFAVGTAIDRYEPMKPTIDQMVDSLKLEK